MTGLALYEIADAYRQLLDLAADPEADDASFAAALEALGGEIEQKGIAAAQIALNLDALAEQINQAVRRMENRGDALRRRAEGIRRYLANAMAVSGIRRIECPQFSIALQPNPPRVVIEEDALIPARYLRHVPERWEPDKMAIAAALKRGEIIDGCRLESAERVVIR